MVERSVNVGCPHTGDYPSMQQGVPHSENEGGVPRRTRWGHWGEGLPQHAEWGGAPWLRRETAN